MVIHLTDDESNGHVSSDAASTVSASGNFVWSDESALNHDTTKSDWANGYKVNSLPLDAETWSY
jgi:hypothetical protein